MEYLKMAMVGDDEETRSEERAVFL